LPPNANLEVSKPVRSAMAHLQRPSSQSTKRSARAGAGAIASTSTSASTGLTSCRGGDAPRAGTHDLRSSWSWSLEWSPSQPWSPVPSTWPSTRPRGCSATAAAAPGQRSITELMSWDPRPSRRAGWCCAPPVGCEIYVTCPYVRTPYGALRAVLCWPVLRRATRWPHRPGQRSNPAPPSVPSRAQRQPVLTHSLTSVAGGRGGRWSGSLSEQRPGKPEKSAYSSARFRARSIYSVINYSWRDVCCSHLYPPTQLLPRSYLPTTIAAAAAACLPVLRARLSCPLPVSIRACPKSHARSTPAAAAPPPSVCPSRPIHPIF